MGTEALSAEVASGASYLIRSTVRTLSGRAAGACTHRHFDGSRAGLVARLRRDLVMATCCAEDQPIGGSVVDDHPGSRSPSPDADSHMDEPRAEARAGIVIGVRKMATCFVGGFLSFRYSAFSSSPVAELRPSSRRRFPRRQPLRLLHRIRHLSFRPRRRHLFRRRPLSLREPETSVFVASRGPRVRPHCWIR